VWYAYLCQLKVWWTLFLPVYLVTYPVWVLFLTIAKLIAKPLAATAETLAAVSDGATKSPQKKKPRRFPKKKVWLLVFFLWIIAFRSLHAIWAVWLLPILLVPIWLWFLKLAYKSATSPGAFAEVVLLGCQSALETVQKQLKNAREQIGKSKTAMPSGTRYAYGLARFALRRYSKERIVAAVHREALAIFSVALVLALVSSAVFWAFVAVAVATTWPGSLNAYSFFADESFLEYIMWALGCMTTSVGFPGSEASVALKSLHSLVLLTGVFEITYLLASFSLMAAAIGQQTATRALGILESVAGRLDGVVKEENELRQLVETSGSTALDQPKPS
jgi:hypothetical protein